MKQRQHFRTLNRITYVWHGEWSDPELIYKKHSFNYWDIEDMFYGMFKDDHEEKEKQLGKKVLFANEEESFNLWLKENKERCYGSLDDLLASC